MARKGARGRAEGFEATDAALRELIEQLARRLSASPEELNDLAPDKALGHILRAISTAAQMDRARKERADEAQVIRAQVMRELRTALRKRPALYDELKALADEENT